MRRIGTGMLAAAIVASTSVASVSVALEQAFHPSMVEAGTAADGEHIIFDPPFPSPPRVVVGSRMIERAVHIECHLTADNITALGFDYHSNCKYHHRIDSIWVATLQQSDAPDKAATQKRPENR